VLEWNSRHSQIRRFNHGHTSKSERPGIGGLS
jgi:hypothetical protein